MRVFKGFLHGKRGDFEENRGKGYFEKKKKFSYKGDSKNKKEDKGSWGIFQKGWEVLIFGGRKRDVERMREERRR